MTTAEIEALLGITIPADQAARYDARIKEAVGHINAECGGQFGTGDAVTIPPGVGMGVALLVKAMGENPSVSSQSLGDMSKSFFEGGTYRAAQAYWKPYRKAKFY